MTTSGGPQRAAGTLYLIAIQVVSRGLTFIGNQALLRYVSPSHLGLAVQLEALSISVLYTARESLRVALQRASGGVAATKSSQAAVNAAYLVILLGLLLGTLLSSFYLNPGRTDLLETSNFSVAFWMYGVATISELLAEPCFVIIQQHALFKDRARAETIAAITRCVAACSAAVYMHRQGTAMSVLPFAVGQLGYGMSLFVVYAWSASKVASLDHFSLLPRRIQDTKATTFSFISKPLLKLASAFYVQSVFKWALTQGDTLVLSYFTDLQSQGIFALASNYGGLASRLLFQPIEESTRNVFGRLVSATGSSPSKPQERLSKPEIMQNRRKALAYLSTTLHVYVLLIVLPCITLLPHIFPILITTLLGRKSQFNSPETSALMSAYAYYLPFLALNGVIDAFVTSVASETELAAQTIMMLAVTILYATAAYAGFEVLELGAASLVYANILNMALRIMFGSWFIRGWTQENILNSPSEGQGGVFRGFCKESLPSWTSLLTAGGVWFGLAKRGDVKAACAGSPNVAGLLATKLARLDLDIFDLTYLFTAAVVLISAILVSEADFLLRTTWPVLPQKVKAMLEPYGTPTMKKKQ